MFLLLVFLATWLTVSFGAKDAVVHISALTQLETNKNSKTSDYILGLSAYAGVGPLTNDSFIEEMHNELGVNVVGFGEQLGAGLFPSDESDAIKCCNTTQDLRNYINSGSACSRFDNTYDPKIWSNNEWWNTLNITTFIYLKDSCNSGQYPELYHCAGPDTGGGTPLNGDEWWSYLMLGFVNCSLQLRPNVKYFHIWNEPNAHFWKYGYNGTYYAEFYYNVTSLIKQYYPNVILSGPVTWCPPGEGGTFNDYFVSLMKKVLNTNSKLLDFIDFHAYNNGNANLSQWDYIVSNLNALSIYYSILAKDGTYNKFIKSHITETNVNLDTEQNEDKQYHWKMRTIANSMQILALSFNGDKFGQRHLFDLGAQDYNFYNSIDYYMHETFDSMSNKNIIYFNVTNYNDKNQFAPRYVSENIMVQVLRDSKNNRINILLVNSDQSLNKVATYQGLENSIKYISNSDGDFGVGMPALSVASIFGEYTNNNMKTLNEVEFLPTSLDDIMYDVSYKNNVNFNINIQINNFNVNTNNIINCYLKLGLLQGATNFAWNIDVTYSNTNYFKISNHLFSFQYVELPLDSSSYNVIKNGATFNIQISGQNVSNSDNLYANDNAKFAFVSMIVAYN